jgi:uncharacterized SAM-binding protein YcdF (DUF218 family)
MQIFIRNIVIVYAAFLTLFGGIFAVIKMAFKQKVFRIFFYFLLSTLALWLGGLALFHHDISKDWRQITVKNPDISEKTDAIVTLTGGSERIRTSLHMIKEGYSDILFISGVNNQVKLAELFAVHGISKEDFFSMVNKVELGFEAKNTIENAAEVEDWIKRNSKIKSIRLVTSNYHLRRSVLEINSKLPNIKIIPHPVIPINVRVDKWWKFDSSRGLIISEYNKLIAAYFRIYLEKLGF